MSTLAATHPTLSDVAKRLDPDGQVDKIVELLNMTNEVLDDAVYLEANQETGHRTTTRSGLPTPTWRKLYGGVQPTKSRTVQVTDTLGSMEAYAEIDKKLADLNGRQAAWRLSEERPHIEGMNQELASTLIYGNESTEPEAFTGLSARFNDLSAANADNIIDCGGSGSDNTSIWLVVWGPDTCHMIYPKGSKAGIKNQDLGEVTIENVDGNGGRMQAYRNHYTMDAGFSLRDWRFVARACNIDVSDLTKDAATGADLIDIMTQMLELPPSLKMGRPAFYVSKRIRSWLRRQMVSKVKNSTLTMDTVAGKRVLFFDEVPVRRVDAITHTEARVT